MKTAVSNIYWTPTAFQAVVRALGMLTHLISTASWGRYCFLHFTDKIKVPRDWVTHPHSTASKWDSWDLQSASLKPGLYSEPLCSNSMKHRMAKSSALSVPLSDAPQTHSSFLYLSVIEWFRISCQLFNTLCIFILSPHMDHRLLKDLDAFFSFATTHSTS